MGNKPPFIDPTPSPPPKTPEELAEAVSRIDNGMQRVLEVGLPRLEDGIIILDGRVSRLEARPTEHTCIEGPRQIRQDDDIISGKVESVEQAEKIRGLVSFRNIIIGSILTVAGAAIWFALTITNDTTANEEKIDAATKAIDRHEQVLADLPRKSDLENLQKAVSRDVSNIPAAMKELEESEPPTVIEVEQAAEKLPLKNHELEALHMIFSRAKKRENEGEIP